jgi:hypothetical protein
MHPSSSLSAPETVSAALACLVYTVYHLDCCHAYSLLYLCSKVIFLHSSYSCIQSPRVPPELLHHCCHCSPLLLLFTAAVTIHRCCYCPPLPPLFTATHPAPPEAEFNGTLHTSKDLLLIASVFPLSTAISPSAVCSLLLSVLCCCHSSPAAHSSSLELTGTFWRSSYSPGTHLESFGILFSC